MQDDEELPDDVPVADAVEQQRSAVVPVPDEAASAEHRVDVPLEVAPPTGRSSSRRSNWIRSSTRLTAESVEFLGSPTLLRDAAPCGQAFESPRLVPSVEREPNYCAGRRFPRAAP
jgi:hypothetical protein